MVVRIARACGLSHTAVSQWRQVPARHLRTVAEVAKVPLEQLVPASTAAPAAKVA